MNIVLIELIFVAVVALGFGFWQLYDVNRELRKDRDRDDLQDRDHRQDVDNREAGDNRQAGNNRQDDEND